VQALFDNRDNPTVTDNAALFDFNGNGVFNLADVQALWAQLNPGSN